MTDFAEKYLELSRTCLKHTMELNELNMKAFNDLSKSAHFDEIVNTRDMEGVMRLQQKMMNDFNKVSQDYIKKCTDLISKSSSDITERVVGLATEFGHMAETATRNAADKIKAVREKE